MNRLLQKLKVGGSTLALVSAAAFIANQAIAQETPAAAQPIETVTVTGTNIRGASVVGSSVETVGEADLEQTGASNISSALADVPSLMFFGSADRDVTQGANGQPGISVGIHQIGAMSSATTLVLIDGHRALESGNSNYFVNPNQLPGNMVERVDVLADGASAIYGSDAVAGVVNFITRKQFEGVQLNVQSTVANGTTGYEGDALVGSSWSGGNFVLGAEYGYDSKLNDTARPQYGDFQTARAAAAGVTGTGTSNFGSFYCNPATLQPGGTGNIFLNATTSGTSVINTAANQPCQQYNETVILPEEQRLNAMLRVNQAIGSRLTLSTDVLISNRTTQNAIAAGTLTGTAFSTGAQANPFYVTPAGYTGTATNETIRWDADGMLPPGQNTSENSDYMFDSSLDYNVDDNWDINFNLTTGQDYLGIDSTGTLNTANALLALNGTGQQGGSATTTDIPGSNNISLNLPLTTTNALDVWDPAGPNNKTSPAVIASLTNNANINDNYFSLLDYKLSANGTLFQTAAGPVKIATGAEVNNIAEKQFGNKPGEAGGASVDSDFYYWTEGRDDLAEYLEADIPVVGPKMGVPLIQNFEIDIAGRHDDYSDFGGTSNTKFAFNWDVINGVRLRGNMATSFIAPSLPLEGTPSSYGSYGGTTGGSLGNVPVSAYPAVTSFGIPGCTASSATCNITSLQGETLSIGGAPGQPITKPATGRTWSLGADISPDFLPGFSGTVTYWHVSADNLVAQPNPGIVLHNPSLSQDVKFYPGCATQAQIAPYTLSATGAPIPQTAPLPSCVQYIFVNLTDDDLYLKVNGIDYHFDYKYDADDYGIFTVGTTGTQLLQFKDGFNYGGPPPADELFSTLNTEGINGGFPAVAETARSHLGWQKGGIQTTVFWNLTGPYTNANSTSVNPIQSNALGLYDGMGGDHVNSNSTFDMYLSYSFNDGVLGDETLALVIDNFTNKSPPFFNAGPSARTGGGYDPFLASPIGRSFMLGLKTKF